MRRQANVLEQLPENLSQTLLETKAKSLAEDQTKQAPLSPSAGTMTLGPSRIRAASAGRFREYWTLNENNGL